MAKTSSSIIVVLLAVFWNLLSIAVIQANPDPPRQSEYKLKAAFLLNFLHFIDWPPAAFAADNSHFVIGIVGEDPFEGSLDQIVKGDSINGRTIVVRTISSIEDSRTCQILFFPKTQRGRSAPYIEALAGSATLTVGEFDGFIDDGGGINFYVEDDKLRFEIDVHGLQKSGLEASSKLLRLAKIHNGEAKEK